VDDQLNHTVSGAETMRRSLQVRAGPDRSRLGVGVSESARVRNPASERRAEIMRAADAEFAANGLAGTRLEAIAARVGVSRPRIVQMFGSKRSLFLQVVHAAYDRIDPPCS
jgi:hypothetical protein